MKKSIAFVAVLGLFLLGVVIGGLAMHLFQANRVMPPPDRPMGSGMHGGPVFFERFVQKRFFQQEPDEARIAEQLAAAEPLFDYLDGEIGDRDVMVCTLFSVADIAIGSVFVNFGHGGERVDPARWPQLAAYVDRIHARPSFKQIIEAEKADNPS